MSLALERVRAQISLCFDEFFYDYLISKRKGLTWGCKEEER